ncbi:hypothetical protein ES332_D11G358900v1 [Gossypium tomentosum]|uniref:AAA+ ATPase domain-containing protein n=1 Tax=Gossypium tomentosum TaxID=34277 RepID=A0A5D2IWD4_GOSTO|nr:hypothetical protein ES332_D11G358900v1 [Gossypium tomentosum]
MAWSAVTSAVTTIGNLLTQEAIYLWGVEEQVDRLQTELKWMQSSLMEAETKQSKDERIRLWLAEIRELAYDAEDIVEEFALKIGSKNKGGLPSCIKRSACCLKEGWVLHETRSKIEKIIERINDLVRRLQAYGVKELKDRGEESSFSTERRESRRPYPHIMDDNIVGLVDDTEGLVKVLKNESGSKFVTIWGMGGLGKTTLAKKIYHHRQVIDYFDHLAFVYVSQPCQKRNVWEDILSGFKTLDKVDRKKRDEALAEKLYNILEVKKCLVILDDIWTSEAWDSLKPAFPVATGRHSNSKILLTSRNRGIVSDAEIRELKCLNDQQSWELFQKIVFPQTGNIIDVEMKKLGENMVKHCAGLPLAIVVLGGILATKNNSLNEWQKISNCCAEACERRGKNQGPEDVLALSYDDFPPYLRPCFLYLSHFPEDYMIDVDRLIQLWVAEGIVSSKQEERDGGEIAEDVAESYLMELVERCLIQVRERDVATLKVKTIQMHDLMRDLCLSKAKQENFVFIVDQSNASSLSMIRKVRRVSVHEFFFIQCIKSPNIRSLLFFNEFFPLEELEKSLPLEVLNYVKEHDDEVWHPLYLILLISVISTMALKAWGIWRYMFNNFQLLRALNYEGTTGDSFAGFKLPSDIGNLIHLRFLSLKDLRFFWGKLPSSLGNLRCLQTLDLRVDSYRIHVPNVIWRMEELRHLYLGFDFESSSKLKLGTLRKLLTLVNFNTKNCYLKDLINMTNLRELEIFGPFNIENFNEKELGENPPIIGSKYLHSLSIITPGDESIDPKHLAQLLSNCTSICKLSIGIRISELPEYHYFSSHLAYIQLSRCKLEKDPMPTLEKLPNLRILEFEISFVGKEMFCSAPGFPKLETLILAEHFALEEWKVDEGAMPSIQRLEITDCPGLNMLPEGLRFITTLKELKIESMPKAFKDRLEEGGEDFYKVKHVPSIIFQNILR